MIGPKIPKLTTAEMRQNRATVKARSKGVCEGCGVRPATDIHHRLYRSRGGRDEVVNLLHLCGGMSGLPGGNHSGCHGLAHTDLGERRGWSVRTYKNPASIPVIFPDGTRWLLLVDGTREAVA